MGDARVVSQIETGPEEDGAELQNIIRLKYRWTVSFKYVLNFLYHFSVCRPFDQHQRQGLVFIKRGNEARKGFGRPIFFRTAASGVDRHDSLAFEDAGGGGFGRCAPIGRVLPG